MGPKPCQILWRFVQSGGVVKILAGIARTRRVYPAELDLLLKAERSVKQQS